MVSANPVLERRDEASLQVAFGDCACMAARWPKKVEHLGVIPEQTNGEPSLNAGMAALNVVETEDARYDVGETFYLRPDQFRLAYK